MKRNCLTFDKFRPYLLAGIFIVGILMRVLFFWDMPAGLNQDEASIGYDTYADITYGMDRNGYHNPVYSVAWGSGHSSLYITLSKPFIALFGLNTFSVRIVNVLFGCVALFAFYGLIRRLKDEKFAMLGLFLLAINPWHIQMSRWGLECNLFPNIFIIATYFLAVALKNPKLYPVSLFIYGLSLYAYGTSYMVVPLFLVVMAVYLVIHQKITLKMLVLSFAVFVMTALPIGIFMLINVLKLEPIQLSWISFPRLISGRYNSTVTVLGGNGLTNIWNNFITTMRLLITQQDGLIWNTTKEFGTVYVFSMPFAMLGFIKVIYDNVRYKTYHNSFLWIAISIGCIVLGLISEVNVNRANIFFVPILYFITAGMMIFIREIEKIAFLFVITYTVLFGSYAYFYFTEYQQQIAPAFFDGAGEAIVYATEHCNGSIYMTDQINAPYIIAMFYLKTDPKVFIDTVNYLNPEDEARYVLSFDRFHTGIPSTVYVSDNAAYVIENEQAKYFQNKWFTLKQFGYYTVAIKR